MAQVKFSVAIRNDAYKNLINQTLGDKEVARNFIANISTAVSNNPALQECDAGSIITAGLVAESLKLSLSNSLGYCYLIPFNCKNKSTGTYEKKAQFQLGWKGFIQLAQRSGQYKKIGVREVHKGEYLGQDEFGEDMFKFSHDFDNEEVVGYFAYFELLNGFRKTIYWTKEQCEKHARKYSKSYDKLRSTDFDMMSQKTVLKQLISKWGVMSIELQKAVQSDQAVIREDGTYDYVDNPQNDSENHANLKSNVENTLNFDTGEIEENDSERKENNW